MILKFQILKLSGEFTNFSSDVTEFTFNTLAILVLFAGFPFHISTRRPTAL